MDKEKVKDNEKINKGSFYIDESLVQNKTYYEHVKTHVTCTICDGLLNDPVICSSCETPYCRNCIKTWQEKNNSCPARCSPPLIVKNIFRMLKNTLDEVKVKCKINDCIVSLTNYGDHVSQCAEINKVVTCWNCQNPKVKKSDLKMVEEDYKFVIDKASNVEVLRLKYEDDDRRNKEIINHLTKENEILKAGRIVNNLDKDLRNTQMERTKKELEDLIAENKEIKGKFNDSTKMYDEALKTIAENEDKYQLMKRNNKIWEDGINEHIIQRAQLETMIRVREDKIKTIKEDLNETIQKLKQEKDEMSELCKSELEKAKKENHMLRVELDKHIKNAEKIDINYYGPDIPESIIQPIKHFTETHTLKGHEDYVKCLAVVFLGGEQVIVSGSYDSSIKLWNPLIKGDNKLMLTLRSHQSYVYCVSSYKLDKEVRLISGSGDKTIKIWNPFGKFDKLVDTLVGHTGAVFCLSVLRLNTEELIVSGSLDRTIKVWNPQKSEKLLMTLKGHEDYILALSTLRLNNEEFIVSGGEDKMIKVWNPLAKEKLFMSIPAHDKDVTCLTTLEVNNEDLIVSGSWDRTIKIWNIFAENNKLVSVLKGHEKAVCCINTLRINNEDFIVSGSEDHTIKIWNPLSKTEKLLMTISVNDEVYCLNCIKLENEDLLVAGSRDTTIKIMRIISKF